MADILGNLRSILAAANQTTGKADKNMTEAVQSLMEGFGGGYPGDTTVMDFLMDGSRIVNHTVETFRDAALQPGYNGNKILKEIEFYALKVVPDFAFKDNKMLERVHCLACEEIGAESFEWCAIAKADFPRVRIIKIYAFYEVLQLETLILRSPVPVQLQAAAGDVFTRTKILDGSGFVYVPRSLVQQYQTETNWAAIAGQIRAIEDYPEITGGAI